MSLNYDENAGTTPGTRNWAAEAAKLVHIHGHFHPHDKTPAPERVRFMVMVEIEANAEMNGDEVGDDTRPTVYQLGRKLADVIEGKDVSTCGDRNPLGFCDGCTGCHGYEVGAVTIERAVL